MVKETSDTVLMYGIATAMGLACSPKGQPVVWPRLQSLLAVQPSAGEFRWSRRFDGCDGRSLYDLAVMISFALHGIKEIFILSRIIITTPYVDSLSALMSGNGSWLFTFGPSVHVVLVQS